MALGFDESALQDEDRRVREATSALLPKVAVALLKL